MKTIKIKRSLFRNHLYITDKPYYIKKSEKNGENDLYNLVKKVDREHAWVFFPKKEYWISCITGYEKKEYEQTLTFPLIEASQLGNNQIYYHTHPIHALKEVKIEEFIKTKSLSKEEIINLNRVINALPSEADYISAGDLMGKEMRIVSNEGIFSLISSNLNPIHKIDYYAFISDTLKSCFKVLQQKGVICILEEITKEMCHFSNNYISTKFRPKQI